MTSAASSSTTVPFVFKRRYSDRQAAEATMRDSPTYQRIAKREGLGGSDFVYGFVTTNPQGIANTFTAAQTADETLKGEQFVCQDVQKYMVVTIDGPSMLRNQNNNAKLIDLVTRTMDGGLAQMGYEIGFDLFRAGTGLRGRRSSASGNDITLTSRRDVENFERGMTVIASANANGSSPRAGSAKVSKLGRSTTTITLDDASTITSFQDGDYLFRLGAAQNAIDGMGSCTPLAAPTAGVTFRGVERTNELEKLAGTRIDDTGRYPEQMIGDLATELWIMRKRVDRATVYPTVFQSMVNRLGAKVTFTNPGGPANVGFEEIKIYAGGYAITVTADPFALPTEVRVWKDDAHELLYLGSDIVHLIRDDGQVRRAQTGNDGFEVRGRSVLNYLQPDTAAHGVGSFLT